jgi:hypothetical protein
MAKKLVKTKGTIVFVDIVKSTELWKSKRDDYVLNSIEKLFKTIRKFARKNKGKVIKTIGDASLLFFRGKSSLENSVDFALQLLTYIIDSDDLNVRIGVAYGYSIERNHTIQNCRVKDFYGTIVNIASRLESKISPPNGFAMYSIHRVPEALLRKIQKSKIVKEIKTVLVTPHLNDCVKSNKADRSIECIPEDFLKGVKDIIAYKIITR